MLETVKRLVDQPTQHMDVRCVVHSRGLRFVVETHPVRGRSGSSIEHLDWQTLDAAVSALAAQTVLEDAYNRAIEGADYLLTEGPVAQLVGGPRDGDTVAWDPAGGDTIKVAETRQEQGMGFANKLRPPREGTYRRTRPGVFHWQGWN